MIESEGLYAQAKTSCFAVIPRPSDDKYGLRYSRASLHKESMKEGMIDDKDHFSRIFLGLEHSKISLGMKE